MMYKEGKNISKSFEFLREHTMKIINFKKKKMKLFKREKRESYKNGKCSIPK